MDGAIFLDFSGPVAEYGWAEGALGYRSLLAVLEFDRVTLIELGRFICLGSVLGSGKS